MSDLIDLHNLGLLSTRTYNCLSHTEYQSIAGLETATDAELLTIRFCGPATVREIRTAIGLYRQQTNEPEQRKGRESWFIFGGWCPCWQGARPDSPGPASRSIEGGSTMKPMVHLIQALCGPARHCILGMVYMPGLTAAQKSLGSTEDITLTVDNAADYMRGMVDDLIASRAVNPWCGICRSRRSAWFFEDRATPYQRLDEAEVYLRQCEREQRATAEFFKASLG